MTTDIHLHRILILDFGSQYTQLIARRVREVGVFSEIHPWDMDESAIRAFNPSGIILSGGPESVTAPDSPRAPDVVFSLDVPVLGHLLRHANDGGADGWCGGGLRYLRVRLCPDSAAPWKAGLLHDISDHVDAEGQMALDVWMSHGDKVVTLPPEFRLIAETDSCPIAGMCHRERPWFGIQFHPEVTHTLQGQRIFEHFVLEICGCEALWTPANIVEDAIRRVREQVGTDRVLLGLSGGVDSSVVAALLHRAIGDQLTCVFVDNGLLAPE